MQLLAGPSGGARVLRGGRSAAAGRASAVSVSVRPQTTAIRSRHCVAPSASAAVSSTLRRPTLRTSTSSTNSSCRVLRSRVAGSGGSIAASGRGRGRSGVAVSVSANLFARIYRIVTSFFNGLVGSFEDPEKLLDRVTEEMQEDMIRMRQATAQVMASQRQLSAKQKSLQSSADQWLQRAELAVARGQDDLAREALKRRKILQEDADRLNEQVVLQTQALEQLQANVRMLEGKMGEARSKKETLKARAASAKTSLALQEMIGGLQVRTGTSWAAFEQMEEKVAAMEAQAATATALTAPDSLERQFAALEGDTGVDLELAELKKQAAASPRQGPPRALPPVTGPPPPIMGRPLRDVFDPLERELEDLRRRSRE